MVHEKQQNVTRQGLYVRVVDQVEHQLTIDTVNLQHKQYQL